MSPAPSPLIEIRDLRVRFPIKKGGIFARAHWLEALGGVNLDILSGEVFGLVGESGCGKTTLGRALVGIAPIAEGTISFEGKPLVSDTSAEALERARKIQLVFQDPYSSLHPRKKVRDLIGEGLEIHDEAQGVEVDERCLEQLEKVGLGRDHLYRFAHEFSGGQRQRLALARALILKPQLVVLDEPTSALDVSVQAQILNLLNDLRRELNLTYLFISHDLGVIRYLATRTGVMYLGHIVETGPTEEVFDHPRHPYTRSLLDSLPSIANTKRTRHALLEGDPPTPIDPPPGCPFANRCPRVEAICRVDRPALEIPDGSTNVAACHFPLERTRV
ncbi:MAG: ABC transporter ATP-binding protein [Gammaproteobacteria bacterium]